MSTLERKKGSRPGPMEAMPPLATFAARYESGAPQVVWMRLVADLETPVSAYLKLAAGRPMSFLFESVEGGATRGRYSVIGLEPDLVWRAEGDTAAINRTPVAKPDAFRPDKLPTLASLRALLAESELELPSGAAAHVGRRVRIRGLRHHTARRAPARRAARRAARPRQHPDAPDRDGDLRRGEGRDHHRDAGAPQCAADAGSSLQGRLQAPEERGRGARQAAAAHAVDRRSQAAGTQARLQHDARPLQGDGAAGQGVHRRRRHLPGRALAALLRPLHAAALRALSGAAPHQPLALSLPSRPRRLRARRIEPGDPRARAQRRGDDPAHRRHGAARGDRRRGPGARRGHCSRIPRSAPST